MALVDMIADLFGDYGAVLDERTVLVERFAWNNGPNRYLSAEEQALRHASRNLRHQLKLERRQHQMQERKAHVGNITGSTPGPHVPSGNENADLDRILNVKEPLRIVAGRDSSPTDNQVVRKRVPDDAELLARTAHVRGKKETMMEFYARVGLGKSQILTMSREEISRFVEVAEQSAADTAQVNTTFFEPKAIPPRFILT